ncbi:hypothetical protein M0R45_013336 [Rubus argutus]|uniref:Casein kinase substrate phosphoprotein PP28 domain-containing protein n=1 Tax=Rubus argutus TaxID=59490 RepID=A0AAW1XI02_RUBAR
MGRGKYKSKPTGHRQFSSREDLLAGTSTRPRSFSKREAEHEEEPEEDFVSFEDGSEEESDGQDEVKEERHSGIIEIENPNLVKPKTLKAKDIDIEKPTELSRREREALEKQRAHERYMKLQEQGKTEQAKKDLGNFYRFLIVLSIKDTDVVADMGIVCLKAFALIRQQRAEAAKKREEEKAAKEQKKAESRK